MWTTNDLNWLSKSYPELKQVEPSILEGRLSFQMLHSGGEYFVNPSSDKVYKANKPDDYYICDTYNVRIIWENDSPYPAAYEIDGKISSVAKRLGKNLIDMHQFPLTGDLCLASVMEYEDTFSNGFKLDVFVEEFLIPYLFAQTYYAKTQIWLWGDLSHDYLGLLEWLGRKNKHDDREILSTYNALMRLSNKEMLKKLFQKRLRGYKPCLCQSLKKTRDCHPEIQLAFSRIRDAINRKIINISV